MREEEYMLDTQPATMEGRPREEFSFDSIIDTVEEMNDATLPYEGEINEDAQPLLEDEDPICDAEPQAELTEESSESEAPLTEGPELYKNADFISACGCGYKEVIMEDVTGAMQFLVRAIDGEKLDMQCKGCGSKFELRFEQKPEVVEEMNDEQVPEDNKTQE